MLRFEDKIAVITGGAQGIGRAIAADCAQVGASVVIADVNIEAAKRAADELSKEFAQRVVALKTDVTVIDDVRDLARRVVDQFGRIDILVNNAGWDRFGLFLETTPDFWEKVIAVNYVGVLNTCHAFLPYMIGQKAGAIVNIASDAGRGGSFGESIYAGCKAAVIAFSKTLAREHARDNIRVNVVSPGVTDTSLLTAMSESELGGKIMQTIVKSVPLGQRPGLPQEISPAVVFLASDAARYITGQVLSVSGGLTMVD